MAKILQSLEFDWRGWNQILKVPEAWQKCYGLGETIKVRFNSLSHRVVVEVDAGACRDLKLRLSWGDGPRQQKSMKLFESSLGNEFVASFKSGRRRVIPITISLSKSVAAQNG